MKIEKKNLMDVLQSDETDSSEDTTATKKPHTYVKTSVIFSKAYEDARTQETTYDKPVEENKITAENVMQEAKGMDATMMRDQMLFSVNTTTSEDSKQMKEDGFALHDTDIHTVITETDKIKLQLAKSGVDISYMGGGLSEAKLQEMTGSTAQAVELKSQIEKADLPATEENLTDTKETFDMASSLKKLTDGAMKYMLDNKCVPSVTNLYKAQFSGSASYMSNSSTSNIDFSQMQSQISNVITNAGLPVNDTTLQNSEWMITNNVSFTATNLKYMTTLQNLTLPPDTGTVMSSVTEALTDGNRPQDALVAPGFSLMDQAQNAQNVIDTTTDADLSYVVDNHMDLTISNLSVAQRQIQANPYLYMNSSTTDANAAVTATGTGVATSIKSSTDAASLGDTSVEVSDTSALSATQTGQTKNGNGEDTSNEQQSSENKSSKSDTPLTLVTAKRQLEEVRLAMSSQANYSLLKQGISIDTKPLSQLVDDLKNTENQYYSNLLTGCNANASTENVNLFKNTSNTVNELKTMPAYALGLHATRDVTTLNSLHETAQAVQENLTKANQSYETMMTQPRSDLGDSITKAFQNVDTILSDLDMDTSDSNQRAVRILAYNTMDITKDNITKVKSVDEQVQAAFKNLSPAVVRQMIKTGTNPLDMNLTQLNEAADEISNQLDTGGSEKFSEYLYKLEQNNDISSDERSSYIGIYRLMNQVEQTDGAAVGALISQSSDVTMRNLLTVVRSSKNSGMDIKVDDATGEKTAKQDTSDQTSLSITDQIEKGYQTDCIKNALSLATPSRLKTVMNNNKSWQDLTPEAFLGQLRNTSEDETASDDYQTQQVNELSKTAVASEDVFSLLQKYDIQNTASNVMAIQEMMSNRNGAYKKLFQELNSSEESSESSASQDTDTSLSDATKEMLETYGEAVKTPETMKQAIDQLEETASGTLSNYLGNKADITSMKVKEMKLMYKQVALAGQMANKETYSFPIAIQNEITNVNLKIVRGEESKGLVNITFETGQLGKVAAQLSYDSQNITGYVACDNKDTKELLNANIEQITSGLQNSVEQNTNSVATTDSDNQTNVSLQVILNQPLDLNHFLENTKNGSIKEESTDKSNLVQTTTLYKMAESFLKTTKGIAVS